MPVVKIKDKELTQRCANCGALHAHDVAALKLGHDRDLHAIALRPCGACGAVETLFRTVDALPVDAPVSFRAHRDAVNALADRLVGPSQLTPLVDALLDVVVEADPA